MRMTMIFQGGKKKVLKEIRRKNHFGTIKIYRCIKQALHVTSIKCMEESNARWGNAFSSSVKQTNKKHSRIPNFFVKRIVR